MANVQKQKIICPLLGVSMSLFTDTFETSGTAKHNIEFLGSPFSLTEEKKMNCKEKLF